MEYLAMNFNGCMSLKTVDTSSWDFSKVSKIMNFNGCTSLKTVDTSILDFSKVSKMVMLDKMNFNQFQWCKDKGIIENLKPEVAKELNMCAFYAIIDSSLVSEFESL